MSGRFAVVVIDEDWHAGHAAGPFVVRLESD
jgi:hypothetical protein